MFKYEQNAESDVFIYNFCKSNYYKFVSFWMFVNENILIAKVTSETLRTYLKAMILCLKPIKNEQDMWSF